MIITRGVEVASAEGLAGLTIGRLAADLGISKSGLLGHFGSKEVLQIAVIDAAAQIFASEVADRAVDTAYGVPQLPALCEAWISYHERNVFPGGCFFAAAATEFDGRVGPVRDALVGLLTLWRNDLRRQIHAAVVAAELPMHTDPDQVVFELIGIMLALNHALQVYGDSNAPDRARQAVNRLLSMGLCKGIA